MQKYRSRAPMDHSLCLQNGNKVSRTKTIHQHVISWTIGQKWRFSCVVRTRSASGELVRDALPPSGSYIRIKHGHVKATIFLRLKLSPSRNKNNRLWVLLHQPLRLYVSNTLCWKSNTLSQAESPESCSESVSNIRKCESRQIEFSVMQQKSSEKTFYPVKLTVVISADCLGQENASNCHHSA